MIIKLVLLAILAYIVTIFVVRQHPQACGGIAANLPQFQCKRGFYCRVKDSPDALGTCVFRLDIFTNTPGR